MSLFPTPTTKTQSAKKSTWDEDFFSDIDPKAARMIKILSEDNFKSIITTSRIDWQLLSWAGFAVTRAVFKRLIESVFALIILILVSPIILLSALAIKLNSPGPVFFKQKRVGRGGKLFDLYKFRSMTTDAEERKSELMELNEADEVLFKIRKDPRVTFVGRIIRKTSIDELPQLFNVLVGNMHLVGPRPSLPIEYDNYQFDHLRRLDVPPGITGLQQISGRSDLSFKRSIELDLQYVDDHGLIKDFIILIKTIPAVLTGKGAY